MTRIQVTLEVSDFSADDFKRDLQSMLREGGKIQGSRRFALYSEMVSREEISEYASSAREEVDSAIKYLSDAIDRLSYGETQNEFNDSVDKAFTYVLKAVNALARNV